jgi:hypothetical protein
MVTVPGGRMAGMLSLASLLGFAGSCLNVCRTRAVSTPGHHADEEHE